MSRKPKAIRDHERAHGRGAARSSARPDGPRAAQLEEAPSPRDTERIVVAGPNAVEAVLDSAQRQGSKSRDGKRVPVTIARVHRVFLEDTAGGRSQRLAQRAHGLGIAVSMMGKGGATLAPFHDFEETLDPDLVEMVMTRQQEILDGLFRVPIDEEPPVTIFGEEQEG